MEIELEQIKRQKRFLTKLVGDPNSNLKEIIHAIEILNSMHHYHDLSNKVSFLIIKFLRDFKYDKKLFKTCLTYFKIRTYKITSENIAFLLKKHYKQKRLIIDLIKIITLKKQYDLLSIGPFIINKYFPKNLINILLEFYKNDITTTCFILSIRSNFVLQCFNIIRIINSQSYINNSTNNRYNRFIYLLNERILNSKGCINISSLNTTSDIKKIFKTSNSISSICKKLDFVFKDDTIYYFLDENDIQQTFLTCLIQFKFIKDKTIIFLINFKPKAIPSLRITGSLY